jgi:hypothetical protein
MSRSEGFGRRFANCLGTCGNRPLRLPRQPRLPAGRISLVAFFKKVGNDLWSVRVGRSHRAIGRFDGDTLVRIWIGDHDDDDLLVR